MFLVRNNNSNQYLSRSICRSLSSNASAVPNKCPFESANTSNDSPKKQSQSLVDTPEEYAKARPFSEMPGPSALQLIVNMMLPSGKYYKKGLKDLHGLMKEEYGSVVKFPGIFGRDPLVFIYDAFDVEKVYRNEGPLPYRRGFEFFQEFRQNSRPEIFGGMGGLLQSQGQEWQTTRTKVNPVMMQPKTVTRYIGVVDKIAEDFVTRIRSIRDDKNEVPTDFSNEMNKWALESIAYIGLDQRLGLLKETDPQSDGQKLIECVHLFFDLSYQMEVGPSLWKYVKTPGYHKMMKCLNTMTDILISYIDKSMAEIEKRGPNTHGEESVLEKLLKIDKKVAIIMALDMLMAGVDTTSNTVLTLLYFLAKNPDKQVLLRQEILEKLPTKDTEFTGEAMKNMPYLRACMKEAQRLEPVIVGGLRKPDRDVVLGGYQVPEQYQVVLAQSIKSSLHQYYARSDEFLPERFLKTDKSQELKTQQPFAFLPFGFGPRMCIGKRLAELEIETVVARIIRNFNVEWHHPEMKYSTNTFLNAPTGDLKFRFNEV